MDEYSVIADLLHTFRTMSDGVKILAIYMPCIFGLGAMALYLYHLRHKSRPRDVQDEGQTLQGTILPPPEERPWLKKTLTVPAEHPTLEKLRRLNDYVAREVLHDKDKR
ncbi:hypothetical protein [Agrobacterium larrymoorei]|uniref:Uncharacterized protein n=1 Tax=Agrobacterium larrymoorei TaxID=160699 RepID=A0A4D7DVK5_9HYPH|nr:hypothetical protein [Agrobacterium larrymoorei]QCI98262.1 hypothetical protein CFBP5473_10285 [Agrobacterium larrymoorei]QYA06286.1 hypothetical protein J5285_09445 [Agrobacterium larrymoorei]